jgi:EAL domain-containing protein (putative c-di-GMP-specific phosphodiesterase class I)
MPSLLSLPTSVDDVLRRATSAPDAREPVVRGDAGRLYLWFPVGLAMRKVRSYLARVDREFVGTPTGALSVDAPDGYPWELVLELADLLSDDEGADTRCVYKAGSDELDVEDIRLVRTIQELRRVHESQWFIELLRADRLTSVFQPIVFADETSRVLGHEAFVRGIADDGQTVSPGSLFDAARGCGMLSQLDSAARRSAIRAAAELGESRQLFLNFTPEDICCGKEGLRPTVEAIDTLGIARERVVFEITEAEQTLDARHLRAIVDAVRESGFRVALDDICGAEHSRQLVHDVRPDFVKLDMHRVRCADLSSPESQHAERLLELAQHLRIETIAECVETGEELEWNRARGATYVQGFLIGRPMPAARDSVAARV